MAVTRNFSFSELDGPLLDRLSREGNQSAVVREALKRYYDNTDPEPTLAQVLETIAGLQAGQVEINQKLDKLLAR